MSELSRAKKVCAGHRGGATRMVTKVDHLMAEPSPSPASLAQLRLSLNKKLELLDRLDDEYLSKIPENDVADEIASSDEFKVCSHREYRACPDSARHSSSRCRYGFSSSFYCRTQGKTPQTHSEIIRWGYHCMDSILGLLQGWSTRQPLLIRCWQVQLSEGLASANSSRFYFWIVPYFLELPWGGLHLREAIRKQASDRVQAYGPSH